MMTSRKAKGKPLWPFLIPICVALCALALYVGCRIYSSNKILIPYSVIALLVGTLFEYKRICENWKNFLGSALISFFSSFAVFLPGHSERNYSIELHIELWPYAFLLILSMIAITFFPKKLIFNLTVGMTLLQSVALIYWAADTDLFIHGNVFTMLCLSIGLILALFTIYTAFKKDPLSKNTRLLLSLWSSVIMLLFAIDNTYRVYTTQNIGHAGNFIGTLYTLINFFILGVSSIYIIQNIYMLIGFLPGRGEFFNDAYFKKIKELKAEHIERYSMEPVSARNSIICILFTGSIFALNYFYNFLPRNLLIWMQFICFPIVINVWDRITIRVRAL